MSWHGFASRPMIGLLGLALGSLGSGLTASAADSPRGGLVDLGPTGRPWKGYQAPPGFRLDVAADEAATGSATAMTFDDAGRLYLIDTPESGHSFDVWESVTLADGARLRLQKRRRSTLDSIRRLIDTDRDGRFDQSEVVIEGLENPAALLWTKHAIFIAALGRLERWKDDDADGRYESRTILLDGFGGVDARGLSGLTLGTDGYLYLTAGDNGNHPFAPAGSALNLARSGGLFRCRLDGTDLRMLASGLRQPRGNLAFDGDSQPFLIDDDGADGSKLAGVRLIQPVEAGDYGWRTLPGSPTTPDLELGAVDGERPGRLAPFARLAGPAPTSFVIYHGTQLPEACRGLAIAADPARHAIRGFKLGESGGLATLVGETTLLGADDPSFRPEQIAVGADGALYVLDRRDQATPSSDQTPHRPQAGRRILRLSGADDLASRDEAATQDGDRPATRKKEATAKVEAKTKKEEKTKDEAPAKPDDPAPKAEDRFATFSNEQLAAQGLTDPDYAVAARALRELVERGGVIRPILLAWVGNTTLPTHVRVLAIQGARQLWNDGVEAAMLYLLADPKAEIRRLAAQALAWEPGQSQSRLVPKLLDHLEDPDGRVVREVILGIGRHGATNPGSAAPNLIRWLYAHPQANAPTRDAVLRALERLGDAGVAEVALAVRTRRGAEREQAVRLFAALRSGAAVEELAGLIKIPDLTISERATLIRQYADIPPEPAFSTAAMVDWVLKHSEVDPAVKLAALETCRLVGNPASNLVLAALDDDAEAVRLAAMILAGRTRPPGAMAKVVVVVADDQKSDLERLVAARTLRWGGPAHFKALDSTYLEAESAELRRAALRSMADADRSKALAALTEAMAGPDPATRAEVIAILGETPSGALAAGKAYLDGTLGRPDLPAVLRALEPPKTKDARQVLAAVHRAATEGASALGPEAIRDLVAEKGNPWAGSEVFFRASSRCASCHQVAGKGGRSGPNLDREAHGLDAARLIEAIQHPARTIKPGYEPPRLALAAERHPARPGPLAGLDRQPGEALPAAGTVMPAGLDLTWTPQEFADVVAFLLDDPAQACLREGRHVPLDRWAAAGPFAPGADPLRLPLDRFEPNRALAGLNGQPLSWIPLTGPSGTGQVNLGGFFALQPSRVYAVAQVRSESAQSGWLDASTRGAARVYVNGAKVVERADRSATATLPAGTDVVRVSLKGGWNLVILAADSPASGEPLATLHLATPKPVEVRTPRP